MPLAAARGAAVADLVATGNLGLPGASQLTVSCDAMPRAAPAVMCVLLMDYISSTCTRYDSTMHDASIAHVVNVQASEVMYVAQGSAAPMSDHQTLLQRTPRQTSAPHMIYLKRQCGAA